MSILAERNSKPWIGAVAVMLAAAVLYFLTAARDIVVGDSPELIASAAVLGVPHAPGYPLFAMLGYLFSLLPFGSVAFRVNLLSVACDVATVGLIYFCAWRLTKSQLAAAIAALFLAVTSTFWEWSLATEVFSLNNLFAATLILLLIKWHEEPERSGFLVSAFFVFGLALTNQHTIVLMAPAFCFALGTRWRFLRVRFLLVCFIALVAGFLPYVYVPIVSAHHPAVNWGDVSSIRDLLDLILRRNYGSTRLVAAAEYTGGSALPRLAAFFLSFATAAGFLILVGAIEAYRRARWFFWFSVLAFVFTGPFFVWFTNLNLATSPVALFILRRFFPLSQVVFAPLIAFGVIGIARFVAWLLNSGERVVLRVVPVICLAAVVLTVVLNYRRRDQSHNFIARHLAEDIFTTAPRNSVLFATGDAIAFPLIYLQKVEHVRDDVTLVIVPIFSSDWYVRQLRREHPDLVVPFDRYDPEVNNLKVFVDANPNRTFAVAGSIGNDRSLGASYWPHQSGLLLMIVPRSQDFALAATLDENEKLFGSYHPPAPADVRSDTFEADIQAIYAYPAFNMGASCERAGSAERARAWYERVLAIDPNFSKAREGLTRLER